MGSQLDALELVSCMTLFRHEANTLYAVDPQPRFAAMAEHAEAARSSGVNYRRHDDARQPGGGPLRRTDRRRAHGGPHGLPRWSPAWAGRAGLGWWRRDRPGHLLPFRPSPRIPPCLP